MDDQSQGLIDCARCRREFLPVEPGFMTCPECRLKAPVERPIRYRHRKQQHRPYDEGGPGWENAFKAMEG